MNTFFRGIYERVAWRTGLDILSRGIFLVVNLLIARTLSVSEFGKLGFALSFAQIFYTFMDLGTTSQLMKEMGEFRERADLWVYYLKLRLLFMAASAAVFLALPWLVWRWEHAWIMYFMLIVVSANSLLDFSQCVCNGLNRMDLARRTLLWQRGLAVLGIVVPLIFHPTLIGVIAGMAIGSASGSAVSIWVLWRSSANTWKTPNGWAEWKRIAHWSFPNAVSGAFGMWYLRLAPIILGWVATSHDLGEYNGAFRIFEATYIVPAAIIAVGLPHLASALKAGMASYRRELWGIGLLMVPGGILWACLLGFGGPLIIRILLGQKFAGAAPVLSVLGLAGGMVFLNYFVTALMVVIGAQRRHALHQMLVFLFSVTAHLALVQKLSAVGAAWALFATEVFLFALTASFVARWHKRNEQEPA